MNECDFATTWRLVLPLQSSTAAITHHVICSWRQIREQCHSQTPCWGTGGGTSTGIGPGYKWSPNGLGTVTCDMESSYANIFPPCLEVCVGRSELCIPAKVSTVILCLHQHSRPHASCTPNPKFWAFHFTSKQYRISGHQRNNIKEVAMTTEAHRDQGQGFHMDLSAGRVSVTVVQNRLNCSRAWSRLSWFNWNIEPRINHIAHKLCSTNGEVKLHSALDVQCMFG